VRTHFIFRIFTEVAISAASISTASAARAAEAAAVVAAIEQRILLSAAKRRRKRRRHCRDQFPIPSTAENTVSITNLVQEIFYRAPRELIYHSQHLSGASILFLPYRGSCSIDSILLRLGLAWDHGLGSLLIPGMQWMSMHPAGCIL
jgi:hypothetical protein